MPINSSLLNFMIQSVKRAFDIIEYISQNGNLVRLNDIAHALELQKTTVHNFLDTLKELGYVEQDEITPRYRVTSKLQCLYSPDVNLTSIKTTLKPVLEKLTEMTKETSYLAVQIGSYFRYELKCEPDRSVRISLEEGKECAMEKTAIGKLFMTYSRHLRSATLRKFDQETAAHFSDELALVKKNGYALDLEEYEADLNCVAIPFFHRNTVVAVIGLSGPAFRFKKAEMIAAVDEMRALVKAAFPPKGKNNICLYSCDEKDREKNELPRTLSSVHS